MYLTRVQAAAELIFKGVQDISATLDRALAEGYVITDALVIQGMRPGSLLSGTPEQDQYGRHAGQEYFSICDRADAEEAARAARDAYEARFRGKR